MLQDLNEVGILGDQTDHVIKANRCVLLSESISDL